MVGESSWELPMNATDVVLKQVRTVATAEAPDTSLLDRFVRERDEAAFAALVRRHGPMVLGACGTPPR